MKSWQVLMIIFNNQLKNAMGKDKSNNLEDVKFPLIQCELEKSINSEEPETFTNFFQETKNEVIIDFEKTLINDPQKQYPSVFLYYFLSETLKKVILLKIILVYF